jgi:hypothetical protein
MIYRPSTMFDYGVMRFGDGPPTLLRSNRLHVHHNNFLSQTVSFRNRLARAKHDLLYH